MTLLVSVAVGVVAINVLVYWLRDRAIQRKLLRMLACDDPLHRIAAVPRATLDATDNLVESIATTIAVFVLMTISFGFNLSPWMVILVTVVMIVGGFVAQRRWYRRREAALDLTGAP